MIFDRDHTLVHLAPEQLPRAQRRLSAVAPGLRVEAVRALWASWQGPWPREAAEEPAFWAAFAEALARDYCPGADSAPLAAELARLYYTFSTAYPDVQPTLDALRGAGVRMAVLSNFELPSLAPPLAHAGIEPGQFELLMSSAATGVPKPDPRAYLRVAAALGLEPGACWFVDDLAENVAGARLVGMRAFQIDRAAPGDPAGGVIGSLLDLIGLLPPSRPGPPPHARPPYDRAP